MHNTMYGTDEHLIAENRITSMILYSDQDKRSPSLLSLLGMILTCS